MCIDFCSVALISKRSLDRLEIGVYMNLALRYVFPNKDWDTSIGSVSIFVLVILCLKVFYVQLVFIFEEWFLKTY